MSAKRLAQPLKRAVTAVGKPQKPVSGAALAESQEEDDLSPSDTLSNPELELEPGKLPPKMVAQRTRSWVDKMASLVASRIGLTPVLGKPSREQRVHLHMSSAGSSGSPCQQLALSLELYYNKVALDLYSLGLSTSYETPGEAESDCLTAFGKVESIIPLMTEEFFSDKATLFKELCNAMNRLESTVLANRDSIARHVEFDVLVRDISEMQKELVVLDNELDGPSK